MKSAGCEIIIATRLKTHAAPLRAAGFECIALPFERSLRHPLRDVLALIRLWSAIRRLRPDVVHLVSLKPILLSGLAILTVPRIRYVAAVTGMGYLFSSPDNSARLVQRAVVSLLRIIFRRRNTWIVVQNEDDRALLTDKRIGSSERTTLIPGVGVDLEQFACTAIPTGAPPIVVLPARLIRDKGIEDFATAAEIVKQSVPNVRCVLVGAQDPDNPASLPPSEIDAWVQRGTVEWWGHRKDMWAVFAEATVVCLPSYREGFPKVLLEASACGRPLVATDVAGCRDICRDGINGTRVPVRDPQALARAIIRLLGSGATCAAYGEAGRRIAESEYSVADIAAQTRALYEQICAAGSQP